METNYKTSEGKSIKEIVKDNAGFIAMAGFLAIYGLYFYNWGYKTGLNDGKAKILDEIVQSSYSRGLIMKNPKLGRYVFTASKLDK